jgi:hypothetical protein
VHGNFDEVPLSPLSAPEFEAIHDIAPFTWRCTFHFDVSQIGSPDATKVRSPMTNLPLENLKLVPNLLVRSKTHQEVDAAKCLLQRPSTKVMGAEETQEFTHCKDEQDKLLAPMAKEHMLRKEVGFGLWRRVGDLLVKLQNAEETSKDGMAKLQEELSKLKAQLAERDAVNATRYKIIADLQKAAEDHEKHLSEQTNDLKMSHKKALTDKDTGLSKLKAQLAEKDAVNVTRYKIIAYLEKAAKDRKMSHKKALADKDTELSKIKAHLAEKDADNEIQYRIIAYLAKAAKDSEKRSGEQANELKISHKKAPADKDTGLIKLKTQLGQAGPAAADADHH